MEVQVLIEYYITEVDFHNLRHMIEWFENLAEMFGNVQIDVVFDYQVFLVKGLRVEFPHYLGCFHHPMLPTMTVI